MEGVNSSLKTSLDSLTTPRLTLSELDDIIKVGMHVTCRCVFISRSKQPLRVTEQQWNPNQICQVNESSRSKIRRLIFLPHCMVVLPTYGYLHLNGLK